MFLTLSDLPGVFLPQRLLSLQYPALCLEWRSLHSIYGNVRPALPVPVCLPQLNAYKPVGLSFSAYTLILIIPKLMIITKPLLIRVQGHFPQQWSKNILKLFEKIFHF
ncbi:hypothetical protein MHYP_G00117730 [Metynnis hypsauchen]